MPDAPFNDEAIRAELRKIVERHRSKLLEKLSAAESAVLEEAGAREGVPLDAVQQMHAMFDAGTSDAMRLYELMLEYVDRSR